MSNNPDPTTDPGQPAVYQIRLKGHLGSQWTDWFDGLTITQEEDGDTLLTGPVADQAALHGLLKKVRDLGMPLISVVPGRIREAHRYHSHGDGKCNVINKTTEGVPAKTSVQMKLSALWAALMFLYIYADIFSLYKPGQIEEDDGRTHGSSARNAGIGADGRRPDADPCPHGLPVPGVEARGGRWANIILGALYTAVNIGNLVGETWAYYLLFGVVEMALTLLIVGYAWQVAPR